MPAQKTWHAYRLLYQRTTGCLLMKNYLPSNQQPNQQPIQQPIPNLPDREGVQTAEKQQETQQVASPSPLGEGRGEVEVSKGG